MVMAVAGARAGGPFDRSAQGAATSALLAGTGLPAAGVVGAGAAFVIGMRHKSPWLQDRIRAFSKRFASEALKTAGTEGATNGVVLHVGRPPLSHLGGPTPVPPLPAEWGREELEKQLRQRTVPDLPAGLEHRLAFAEDVGAEVLRLADEVRCDLIVLGTHGRTGLGRLLMGSVAEQVVRRAHCPVLTVRHLPPAGQLLQGG